LVITIRQDREIAKIAKDDRFALANIQPHVARPSQVEPSQPSGTLVVAPPGTISNTAFDGF
jgi:hypothetical protein